MPRRIALCALCVVLLVVCGVVGFAELVDTDALGVLLPFHVPFVVQVVVGVALAAGCAWAGHAAAGRSDDPYLLRRLAIIVAVLVVSFALGQLIKSFVDRPRYRLVVQGLEGIPYCPWYHGLSNADALAATYGIKMNEFGSFPSGHAIQAGSLLTSRLGLSALYPSLRGRWNVVRVAGPALLFVVMCCRMILGAHFLTDVSTGGCIAVAGTLVAMALTARIAAAPATRRRRR